MSRQMAFGEILSDKKLPFRVVFCTVTQSEILFKPSFVSGSLMGQIPRPAENDTALNVLIIVRWR